MSDAIISTEATEVHSDQAGGMIVCPVCGREAQQGLTDFNSLPDDLKIIIASNSPLGAETREICPRCVESDSFPFNLFKRRKVACGCLSAAEGISSGCSNAA